MANATEVNEPFAIALMGPTASGKTALSIELAQHINGEIISVDSALIYRGMDIGTAKPTMAERDGVPHWLIDICEPNQSYSVAEFCSQATDLIEQIHLRGKVPILAGGTMMYFNALINGISSLPKSNPQVRDALQREIDAGLQAKLHEELSAVDPVSAARIHPNDPQRLIRALEVFRNTGRTLTSWQVQDRKACPYPIAQFAIAPLDRGVLHKRIEQRFDLMLEQGLIKEVEALYQRGDLDESMPSIRSVGYRQVWQYLENRLTYAEMRERGIIGTRQLAKRQLTWLRGWEQLDWLDTFAKDNLTKIVAKVTL